MALYLGSEKVQLNLGSITPIKTTNIAEQIAELQDALLDGYGVFFVEGETKGRVFIEGMTFSDFETSALNVPDEDNGVIEATESEVYFAYGTSSISNSFSLDGTEAGKLTKSDLIESRCYKQFDRFPIIDEEEF